MAELKNILFVCSQNKLRSPTAEQVFAEWPGIEVSSAGTNNDAENPLSTELIEWADILFVMERTPPVKDPAEISLAAQGQAANLSRYT
jgi:predicted protein tyrosine phosphatase